MSHSDKINNISIMVNSVTGKMGRAVAEAVVNAGLDLLPLTITGETCKETSGKSTEVSGIDVKHIGDEEKITLLKNIKEKYQNLIIVDYTLPICINENCKMYGDLELNFVMGTTGGNREKLLEDAKKSGVYAVIAPQMGKQIVAFQAMLKYMSDNFPGCFNGYDLTVTESHQASKADTSGTAKAVSENFKALGANFDISHIKLIRNPDEQKNVYGVPEEYLKGHGYHTYHLRSSDGTVSFEFQHNVNGRKVYAEGTVDACLFLDKKIKEKDSKKIYDMIDVLKGGSMR